ncbi:LAME_0D04632g1_1 [Lachancea meyersii CBS 8951]|uniref:LAME_0D04632g1_1 n=1 Tax=Lachancea meyersii CBS 8951 TaxID=1266667 RepID=A0A1G4J879_9SACH|nr:LAME_0D04632g1_1 [Lachancea meyersii CBS 8951]
MTHEHHRLLPIALHIDNSIVFTKETFWIQLQWTKAHLLAMNQRSSVSTVPKTNPLRVGFIGLSATKGWAIKSHYPAILQLPSQFQITAVLNLDVETSKSTISKLKLTRAKAFENIEQFAQYDKIDLVVVSVNVPNFHQLVVDLFKYSQGSPNFKYLFSEWSLGRNLQEAQEIYQLASSRGIRTIVSLQGRKSPYVLRAKELVSQGCIGHINSIEVSVIGGFYGYERPSKSPDYLYDAESGVNLISMAFGHTVDILQYITGSYFSQVNAMIFNNIPTQALIDERGKNMGQEKSKSAPDHLLFQGSLKTGNVPVSCSFKGGTPVKKFTKNLVFDIHGTKGDLKLEGDAGFAEMSNLVLYFCGQRPSEDLSTSSAETMEVYHLRNYNSMVGNILRIYEAVADHHFKTNARSKLTENYTRQGFQFGGFPTFADAILVHRLIDVVLRSHDQKATLPVPDTDNINAPQDVPPLPD